MHIRLETRRNVLEIKYTVRTLIAALLSHHRLKLHVEMVDTGYRIRNTQEMHFCPTWLLRKVFTALTNFRAGVERSQMQGQSKQKYRMRKECQVPRSENLKNCTGVEHSIEKRISEVHRKKQIQYIYSCIQLC
jgi:hypothetical protein